MKKFDYFYTNSIRLLKVYCIGILVFLISRLMMIYSFSSFAELLQQKSDLFNAFVMGFRVDTQSLLYALALPLLIFIVASFFIPEKFNPKKTDKIIRYTYVFVFIVLIIILVFNYFFYQKFKSNFSVLIFALKNDNTEGILMSIWKNYPIVWFFFLLILLILLFNRIFKLFFKKIYHFPFPIYTKMLYAILFLGIYFLGMRGSIGLFPLGTRNLVISGNSFINTIASNGALSLKQAISDRKHYGFDLHTKRNLKQLGFSSPKQALEAYIGKKVDKFDKKYLYKNTPIDSVLEQNPPNVVFVQMESLSDYYLDFHSKTFNLLGSLENELPYLTVLRNFLPKGPRTIQTLEGFIINNVQNLPLSQTIYSHHTFSTSNIKPFHDKSYHTVFASGEELGWRNTGAFYSKQYFDEVQGDYLLLKTQKDAVKNNWGVYDEFLFKSVFDQLKNNRTSKPQFFFVLTTSNHSPYYMIDTYKAYPLEVPKEIDDKLLRKEEAYKNFLTFQYANDQLGRFIHQIRTSELGENTIVVATGDHTNTEFFNFSDKEKFHETAVPLILYIPEKYKKNKNINPNVYGSHKDIFPTLYHLALSDAKYYYSGENLFQKDSSKNFGYSSNHLLINPKGAVIYGNPTKYYQWEKHKNILLTTNDSLLKSLKKLELRGRGYRAILNYVLQKEVLSLKGKK